MSRDEFIGLIGKDVVVDYEFCGELQKWSMKNFYIDENNEIKHNRIKTLITDVFIRKATNPHKGIATHG